MQACSFQGSSMFQWRDPRPPSCPYRVARRSDDCLGGWRRSRLRCTILFCQLQHSTNSVYLQNAQDQYSSVHQATSYLHVQFLRNFPVEKLCGEVVVVRLDSVHLLGPLEAHTLSLQKTLLTIKYLYEARAKIVIATSWDPVVQSDNPVLKSTEALAEYLTSLLQVGVIPVNGSPSLTSVKQEEWVQNDIFLFENLRNFKGEVSNCNGFSQKLASGAAIFVNDSFSLSHKILASTVGITRFCYASLAGFHFEEELMQLLKITDTTRRPYIAIIGGSNFLRNVPALNYLASICDGLFFVGKLSFQIMNGLGMSVPSHFIERNAISEVLQFIQVARARNIPIYYPTDMWCLNNDDYEELRIFNSADLLCGWTPVDIGPSTLEKICCLVPLFKKILWIGPTSYDLTQELSVGVRHLGQILEKSHSDICDIILVGNAACMAVKGTTDSSFQYTKFQNASVVWEFLKGRILPGIAALDKSYPYQIPWTAIFADPMLPLVVDIGSGNGLFLFQMAGNRENYNFLGLEMNERLVTRCLQSLASDNKKNLYFVSTNATSTFRSIISSYPGQLSLVTIQCPNPDFNKEQNRWRMVRRMLVEAVADLLQPNGKVYLQSDVESVLLGMKEQFISCSKGRLVVEGGDGGQQQMENPFGVASNWERHVLDRGAPMYRTMLQKV